jgi:hypothetical protein
MRSGECSRAEAESGEGGGDVVTPSISNPYDYVNYVFKRP